MLAMTMSLQMLQIDPVERLLERLERSTRRNRASILRDLIGLGREGIRRLCGCRLPDPTGALEGTVVRQLARRASATEEVLLELACEPSGDGRRRAVRALAAMPSERAQAIFARVASDPCEPWRDREDARAALAALAVQSGRVRAPQPRPIIPGQSNEVRLVITTHAIERFRKRWAPGLGLSHAKRELLFLATGAVPVRRKTMAGDELWTCKWDEQIVFVVRRDSGERRPICVTVLPPEPEEQSEPR
jgi:hypothetical protein